MKANLKTVDPWQSIPIISSCWLGSDMFKANLTLIANVNHCCFFFFFTVSYTPGGLSSWGRNSSVNESRSSVNYVESTSSSPRSDRRDMDSVDRRRYRGYNALFARESLFYIHVVVF